MARIRTTKPEFWTSEQVVECSTTARLMFIGLWNFSDDAGIHPASLKRVKMEIFPGDSFTEEQIQDWINELIQSGLLKQYEVSGSNYWIITGWHHQKIDKPSYKYPRPIDDDSTNAPRTVDDGSPPDRRDRRDSKEEDSSNPPGPKKQSTKFKPPTVEEVKKYCDERCNGVDPVKFVNHYQTSNWYRGKTKIKDWKACVITWEQDDKNPKPQEDIVYDA